MIGIPTVSGLMRVRASVVELETLPAPPTPTIDRRPRGYIAGNTQASSLTLTNVTVDEGSTLKVFVGCDLAADGVTWNGLALANDLSVESTEFRLECWNLHDCPAGTGSVVADYSVSGPYFKCAFTVVEVQNAAASPLDRMSSAAGTGTSPSSGTTAATTQANEVCLGAVLTEGPQSDDHGTWANGWSDGQVVGTVGGGANVTVDDGYKFVYATGTQVAAKTGITSRDWAAACLTLKEVV
jgi:hypothetical protein